MGGGSGGFNLSLILLVMKQCRAALVKVKLATLFLAALLLVLSPDLLNTAAAAPLAELVAAEQN